MTQQTVFHPAADRGYVSMGWLEARHSFSFGSYYDPAKMGFGALRVINDDRIAAAQGFGTHPHKDMEIITIPTQGAVFHRDSMGSEGIIGTGEVQVMSAGTGVFHSEFNASKEQELKLFQIWLMPRQAGVAPSYAQMSYQYLKGQVRWLVAPLTRHQEQETLRINQDAYVGLLQLDEQEIELATPLPQLGTYLLSIEGQVVINGEQKLGARDAYGHTQAQTKISGGKGAKLLVFHVPM
jgi:quercetin 2,3-dioxygenase